MEKWFYNYIDGSTNMDANALAAIDVIDSQFKVIVAHYITEESRKHTIGINNGTCRFCGRNAPEVTFKQIAHALPNCIGNNVLFGYNECDQCNNKFGRLLETHFANFMHLDHTILGVRGKKGFPKYKMDNAIIETTGTFIGWKDTPLENIVYAPEDGMVRITQKIPGYIPVALYKSLVKMALTMIPETELIHLQRTLEWISEDSHGDSKFKFDSLCLYQGKVDSSLREPGISALIVKRKEQTDKDYPYLMFRLTYSSFMFQVPIPLCNLYLTPGFSQFPYIPTVFDLKYGFNKMQLGKMNLRITETVRMEMTVSIKDIDGTGTIEYIDDNEEAK